MLLLFVVVASAVAVRGKKFPNSIYNNSQSTAPAAAMLVTNITAARAVDQELIYIYIYIYIYVERERENWEISPHTHQQTPTKIGTTTATTTNHTKSMLNDID